jgi:hypothetical protein
MKNKIILMALLSATLLFVGCKEEKVVEYKDKILYNADIRTAVISQLSPEERAFIIKELGGESTDTVYNHPADAPEDDVAFEDKKAIKAVNAVADMVPVPYVGEVVGAITAGLGLFFGFRDRKKKMGVVKALVKTIEEKGDGNLKKAVKENSRKFGVATDLFKIVDKIV